MELRGKPRLVPRCLRFLRAVVLTTGLVLLILPSLACPLPPPALDEPFPSTDHILLCEVTVRNPNIVPEGGDESGTQEQDLESLTGIFADDNDQPRRNYYLKGDCVGDEFEGQRWGADDEAEAAADWSRFIRQRIDEVALEGDETVFGRFPDNVANWCAVPGTLTCTETETPIEVCVQRGPELTGDPIAECPLPPPPGELVSTCDGQSPCTAISFPDTPVGQVEVVTVTFSNGGEEGDAAVGVRVAGTVDPIIGPDGTFHVPVSDPPTDPDNPNTCHPSLATNGFVELEVGGDPCSFDVHFEPFEEGSLAAEVSFTSSVQSELHLVQLAGTGVAGDPAFEFPDLGADTLPRPSACFDAPLEPDGCTVPRVLRVTNIGVGDTTITAARVEPQFVGPPPGFEMAPAIPPAGQVVLSTDDVLDLEIRWCEDPGDPASTQNRGAIVIDHDDPNGTFTLDLVRAPTCPADS